MVDLVFCGDGVELERHAMTPTLLLKVRILNMIRIEVVLLQCQIRIEATTVLCTRGTAALDRSPLVLPLTIG